MSQLTFKLCGSGFNVMFEAKFIGMIDRDVDGFFYWFPSHAPINGASWPGWVLRELADKLDELNKEWSAQIDAEINKGLGTFDVDKPNESTTKDNA